MDGIELLKSWPEFANAGAATLLDQPSWRMTVDLGDRSVTVRRRASAATEDEIWLDIDLSGEAHALGIGDASTFPDLHLLWSHRAALPPAVLLALIEKECGTLFQSIEAFSHKVLSIKGIATSAPTDERLPLVLSADGADHPFSLIRCRRFELALGQLRNLDPTHPDLRGRTRPMYPEYARFPGNTLLLNAIVQNVRLLLPDDTQPRWCAYDVADDDWCICGIEPQNISFGEFLDEALPPCPPPERLKLMHGGRAYATGTAVACGDACAFHIQELVSIGQTV